MTQANGGPGWSNVLCVHDECGIVVGHGRKDFEKATSLLETWEHFNLGWAYTNMPEISVGRSVVVIARSLGLWTINPLRICDARFSRRNVSYSHSTLVGHQLSGEERFSLEMTGDGDVLYKIQTTSKPATAVAALMYPIVRMYQEKFKRDSMARFKTLMECKRHSSKS